MAFQVAVFVAAVLFIVCAVGFGLSCPSSRREKW